MKKLIFTPIRHATAQSKSTGKYVHGTLCKLRVFLLHPTKGWRLVGARHANHDGQAFYKSRVDLAKEIVEYQR